MKINLNKVKQATALKLNITVAQLNIVLVPWGGDKFILEIYNTISNNKKVKVNKKAGLVKVANKTIINNKNGYFVVRVIEYLYNTSKKMSLKILESKVKNFYRINPMLNSMLDIICFQIWFQENEKNKKNTL